MNKLLAISACLLTTQLASAQGTPADYERSAGLSAVTRGKVFRDAVEPHWFGSHFWYKLELPGGTREFIVVDSKTGKRQPAFDHAKLAAALGKSEKKDALPTKLPFEYIDVDEDKIRFVAFDKGWAFDTKNGTLAEGPKPPEPRQPAPGPRKGGNFERPRPPRGDNPWTVSAKDNNLFVRKGNDDEFQLTKDGKVDDSYSTRDLYWSPDFSKLVAVRTKKGDDRKVNIVESSPREQLQPKLITLNYAKPGDRLNVSKPHLFELNQKKEIPLSDELFPNPWNLTRLRWNDDGKAFSFVYNQRGHQALRLLEVDASSGKGRAIINEESKTFIDYAHKQYLHAVPDKDELIWMSERDGWNHLYLYDAKTGTVKNQITKGEWIVRAIDRVDDDKRQIWFQASGIHPEQDPYYLHYCRINFDGTGLVKLTEGDGTHTIRYSPDRTCFVDSYSRVDMPNVTELRSSDDGKLICAIEKGDLSALAKAGWQVPERFAAKGRDGKTDIFGVIYRPTNFDASKKYPVIEQIYAGPQGSFVPKNFRTFHYPQEMAELGFLTVQIDGMGTSNRSKAFHDVCAKNLADAGFPDRILWMKAAAKKYPYIDLTRVGLYGGSAGGQNALGALLFHGEFYKAAAADCGCHDNRMDKVWWNELWMGYPIGPHYSLQSNVTNAHKLTGKLLLTVGEVDSNVDPASTMQVVNALIQANKVFEFVVFPSANHGAGGGPYGARKRKDFFVKSLIGVEPPDRNSPSSTPPKAKEPKKDDPNEAGPKKEEPKKEIEKAKEVAPVPDLAALAAKPTSELRAVSRLFEADRGALRRKYTLSTYPGDYARLKKFYLDWQTGLRHLDDSKLSSESREELTNLLKKIDAESDELDDAFRKRTEIASLLAFTQVIAELEESRRDLKPFEPLQLAARLSDLRSQIDRAREKTAKDLDKGETSAGVFVTKARAERAIEAITASRALLKTWHAFYAGYDPMFTWWTTAPVREVDVALEKFVALLKDKTATRPTEEKDSNSGVIVPRPISNVPTDAPDLQSLVAKPSELAGVIQRYQVELGGFGRGPGSGGDQAERRERQTKLCDGWLEALTKIDFDKLSKTGQIDYLLLRNNLERDRVRFATGAAVSGRPRKAKDDNEIVGRPIGREALLASLKGEMIAYTPEQLVELANREYAWCEAEMKTAAREMGFGDEWKKALEKVKTLHVAPGGQPKVVRDLALEAIEYLRKHGLVTVPPLAEETWRMDMMSPERQKFSPFFTGGEVISVAFPTDTMSHDAKLQSLRGNNVHFSRATVHHELIPGHHLQQFMVSRHQTQRGPFSTPFWTEGWAVYWEMVLYEKGFPKTPEDRVGLMFWRMHRCARIIFSLGFHLGKMTAQECIDFLVEKVGHERENATAEVRRSFAGGYPPLYQAAYLIGAKQFWAMRQELVVSGKMTDRQFHDSILKESHMPIEIVRAAVSDQKLTRDWKPGWKFMGELPDAEWPKRLSTETQQK